MIDTGATQTLISQDIVDDIGIKVSGEDQIVTSFGIGGKEFAFMKKGRMVKGAASMDGYRPQGIKG